MGEQRTAFILILILCLLVVSIPVINVAKAESETIVVPDNYPTIQEAINHANEGDTISVKAGTYYENIVVTKSISLNGESSSNTIIDVYDTKRL
jgi:pectin methylesterase-like acyl-CoA thioesterase